VSQVHPGPLLTVAFQLRDRYVRGGRQDALRMVYRAVRVQGSRGMALSAHPHNRFRGAGLSGRDRRSWWWSTSNSLKVVERPHAVSRSVRAPTLVQRPTKTRLMGRLQGLSPCQLALDH